MLSLTIIHDYKKFLFSCFQSTLNSSLSFVFKKLPKKWNWLILPILGCTWRHTEAECWKTLTLQNIFPIFIFEKEITKNKWSLLDFWWNRLKWKMDNDDLDKLVSRVKYDLHKRKSTTPIKSQRPKKIRLGTDNRYDEDDFYYFTNSESFF